MPQNNYVMTTDSDVLYDPARYTGVSPIIVDNDNDEIRFETSAISAAPSTYDWDVTPYSAGNNINITNHVVSGKDWTNDIGNAVAPKLDSSIFDTYSAAHNNDDIIPYSAGANINITNHVVSGKDWSSDISSTVNTALTNYQTKLTDITDVQVVSALPFILYPNVLYLVTEE